jgi:hypothetical protein
MPTCDTPPQLLPVAGTTQFVLMLHPLATLLFPIHCAPVIPPPQLLPVARTTHFVLILHH